MSNSQSYTHAIVLNHPRENVHHPFYSTWHSFCLSNTLQSFYISQNQEIYQTISGHSAVEMCNMICELLLCPLRLIYLIGSVYLFEKWEVHGKIRVLGKIGSNWKNKRREIVQKLHQIWSSFWQNINLKAKNLMNLFGYDGSISKDIICWQPRKPKKSFFLFLSFFKHSN